MSIVGCKYSATIKVLLHRLAQVPYDFQSWVHSITIFIAWLVCILSTSDFSSICTKLHKQCTEATLGTESLESVVFVTNFHLSLSVFFASIPATFVNALVSCSIFLPHIFLEIGYVYFHCCIPPKCSHHNIAVQLSELRLDRDP
jgi:hypothetical protein